MHSDLMVPHIDDYAVKIDAMSVYNWLQILEYVLVSEVTTFLSK